MIEGRCASFSHSATTVTHSISLHESSTLHCFSSGFNKPTHSPSTCPALQPQIMHHILETP
eukprot:scaffold121569_cov17-Tisochrysis_lutea.AAC.1